MCLVLLVNGLFGIWFSYREQKASLTRIQREQAESAAGKIGEFIKGIESEIGWTTQLPSTASLRERHFDALRLLRQVPAVAEFAWVDAAGREQLRVSRVSTDTVAGRTDLSQEPRFTEPVAHKIYYGPIYFRRESEPYMTLALAGARRDAGVSIAEVNLKFIWDVVSQIKVGKDGLAYVVDARGRLIAHPDISLVLRNTDVSQLSQVLAARAGGQGMPRVEVAQDVQGRRVLTAFAPIVPPGWMVFVELPIAEAYAPLYASLVATGLVLLAGLVLTILASLMLARKMVTPIRVLQTGAAQIGKGALDHRIEIVTGDELEALGNQFNEMAARLQESYATLERKVEERTHQLEFANLAKSRFLAAASHDLRQPLHALGLFVAQLRADIDPVERRRIVARIDSAVAAMNDLFNALLDISKLDAGVLVPDPAVFAIRPLLRRMETTFAGVAHEKGLKLRVMASSAWVRSDPVLLERILLNLVSNAVRYTDRGGVFVGCHRRGDSLRIEVWDSGIGIPDDQRRNIFGEFYQLAGNEAGRRGGLGLGLAIVDRLCRLLGHPIELASIPGRGSRFAVLVPWEAARPEATEPPSPLQEIVDPFRNKLVVVIDDDALVLEGIGGLLRGWGCHVVAGESADAALARLRDRTRCPDLIISDFRLSGRENGIEAIEHLRRAFRIRIPAFLISGDTAPERLREAAAGGYHLLHKPVPPITLRAMLTRFLKDNPVVEDLVGPASVDGRL